MTRKWDGAFAGSLVIAIATALCGQSIDWFQDTHHDFGNRWEGLFGENQGSPAWELRSFLASVEPYSMRSNVDLRIKYYVPDSTEAFIRAQVIHRTRSYLMEPKPNALKNNRGWRDFIGWSTKDILIPKRIASTDLGVLIRLGADSEAVNQFAPAIVYYSATPEPIKTYRFDLFTAKALKDFSFDVFGATGYHRTYKNQPGTGDRGTLSITLQAPEIPEGWTRVVLSPRYESSGEALNLEWKFYNERLP